MQDRRLKVDPEDEWVLSEFSWHINDWGYARAPIKQPDGSYRLTLLHRLLLNPRENECVDHINGDKLDNRKPNLRIAPPHLNKRAYKGRRFKGVYREGARYRAQIKHQKRSYYIGMFDTEEEAARAVNQKARELGVPLFIENEV